MNRTGRTLLVALSWLLTSMVSPALAQDLVARALEAMGGVAALAQLRAIAIRGQDSQWEHESSLEPGPKARSGPAGEAWFVAQRIS